MNQEYRNLIPDAWRRPWMILWTALLPQAVLFWMNIQAWRLMSGELTEAQLWNGFLLFAGETALLAVNIALILFLVLRRCTVTAWAGVLSVAAHAAFLWLVCAVLSDGLLPASVTGWILPLERFFYCQFALIMPGLFFALASFVCFPSRARFWNDFWLTASVCVGVPLVWVAAFHIHSRVGDGAWVTVILICLLVASTFTVLGALVRLVFLLCAAAARAGRAAQMAFAGIAGLVAPIGGLVLNWFLPFPVDFQSPAVYLLAILNGALLVIPDGGSEMRRRILWLGRGLLYPFTLYFFVVFLPFLPLVLPAMLAAGAGFLILAPMVLFLLHTRIISEGFARASAGASRRKAAAWLAIALLAMPAAWLGGAALDRMSLREALRYLYHSSPAGESLYRGNRLALKHSLYRLRDFKEGLHLPFLSDLYTQLVFDGLTLPDEKMREIHRAFFGGDMKPRRAQSDMGTLFSGATRPRVFNAARTTSPPTNAVLATVSTLGAQEQGCRSLLAKLEINNPTDAQDEFVTQIEAPDGVMISGFWLHIGKDRVPGRLCEKKAALWVYRMIRDMTRRDPGVLSYLDKNRLELRVFPLAAHETRRVEIEFLYPQALQPRIVIGDRVLLEEAPFAESGIAVVTVEEGSYIVAPPDALARLPSVLRRPYMHFIVDRSEAGAVEPAAALEQCRNLAARFPDIADCVVTFANYELADYSDTPMPMTGLAEALQDPLLPARGGFCRDRAIRRALNGLAGNEGLLRYPILGVVTAAGSQPVGEAGPPPAARAWPDVAGIYTATDQGEVSAETLEGVQTPVQTMQAAPVPVVLFEAGGKVVACPADAVSSVAMAFPGGSGSVVRVYNPPAETFQPLPAVVRLPADSRYARGAAAWLIQAEGESDACRAYELQPLLAEKSRESGVLVPATAYIVVENSAQWKMLEQAEKKKLANFEELEIAAAPEPATWALALVGALGMLAWRWKRRLNAG